ncbi:MAG: hypothetical protein Q7T25_06195 [Sideroxyarcus sp.]|nr:hypothetical protein [Sideroxyarcus sp.]
MVTADLAQRAKRIASLFLPGLCEISGLIPPVPPQHQILVLWPKLNYSAFMLTRHETPSYLERHLSTVKIV